MKDKLDSVYREEDIEILVSTMNRDSLDFLIPMFPFCHFSKFSILIINQTESSKLLISNYPNIRAINSFEKGLSKSRNLAISNAKGKILVIADDDVAYQTDFSSKIINAFNRFQDAVAINFCAVKSNGCYIKKYPSDSKTKLNTFDIFNVSSIEMTLNKAILDKAEVQFDENFGLGAAFEMGEEAVFLFDLKKKMMKIVFEPQIIVKHEALTTSEKTSEIERYYIMGALLTRIFKNYFIFWLAIKLFFDLKQYKLSIINLMSVLRSAKQGHKKIVEIRNENK
ncbi:MULTISPECIES: glycosyltransferase family 2 protein [Flavobacterium]|uniref:glycosyltransferase family 2 protein n=1 Tax=Flavobacterium TaxID=237 RepID=UPI001FCC9339|nr:MULTISPECIES: glycosyltransferase family A protein [Flavobacterium]UOK41249.1 glycosyltransferase family 2 protein [Flavobacterium enshiense]